MKRVILFLLVIVSSLGAVEENSIRIPLKKKWHDWAKKEILDPCFQSIGEHCDIESLVDALVIYAPNSILAKTAFWMIKYGVPKLEAIDTSAATKVAKATGKWLLSAAYDLAQWSVSEEETFKVDIPSKTEKKILELIRDLATMNVWELMMEKSELEQLGKDVDSVPPLVFIAIATKTKESRGWMKEIEKTRFKWSHFMDGISKKMDAQKKSGELIMQLSGFAKYTHTDLDKLKEYSSRGDWQGFVSYLITDAYS